MINNNPALINPVCFSSNNKHYNIVILALLLLIILSALHN